MLIHSINNVIFAIVEILKKMFQIIEGYFVTLIIKTILGLYSS